MPGAPTGTNPPQPSHMYQPPAMNGTSSGSGTSMGGQSTPARHNLPMAPSVVISPSAPVSIGNTFFTREQILTRPSTSHLLALQKQCLTTSPLPKLARRALFSLDFKPLPEILCLKALGHLSVSTLRDLTSPTKGSATWRSCLAFTKYRRIADKSFSCRSWTNATSFSTSTIPQET